MLKSTSKGKYRYSEELITKLNQDLSKHFKHLHKVDNTMRKTLNGVSRMVMLDRYAQKDLALISLSEGDLVVAKIKDDPMFPTLGTGFVKYVGKTKIKVQIEEEFWQQIDPKYESKDGIITVAKTFISKPLEIFYEQIAARVGSFLAENDREYTNDFIKQIADFKVVPAGRILYGAGSNSAISFFNCYVMPYMHDSRDGIARHRKQIMEIMSRGGGVGTNGSTLRPRNCEALTVGGKSSGSVSWLNDLAILTHLIEQGGSRRGAQMIMLGIWHPDIIEFIISKMQNPNVLSWISKNFKSSTIRHMANQKLKFTPLKPNETKLYNYIIKNPKNFDSETIDDAKNKIKYSGTYEVNNPEFMSGANISVAITDDFMKALKANEKYDLRFPDVVSFTKEQKAFYEKEWEKIGDVNEWEALGYPVKVYDSIPAKELWELINFCATYSAEPGVFFIDNANKMTNARAYDQKVVSTNPCGEQPLAAYSVCNLGAINLSQFIDKSTKEILWDDLKESVHIAVRLLDNVIDKTPYFLKENEIQSKGERRIGLGVMGYHDLLLWRGLKYGSIAANELTKKIFKFIACEAYKMSADIGKKKGFFSFMQSLDKLLNTGFIKKLPNEVRQKIKEAKGLRNSHLLTIAPTGSTGTLVGVSTGLEPYFAFEYYRSGRLGKFMKIEQDIVTNYKNYHNYTKAELPSHFVASMDLTPREHAEVQIIIQEWIDSSISKTVNAPKGYSVKQVAKVYEYLYEGGAKGGTVYVDGSRSAQVLSLSNKDNEEFESIDLGVVSNLSKIENIEEQSANIPSNKSNREIGVKVGSICPICKEGVVEDIGGCNTCTLCNAQLKCDI